MACCPPNTCGNRSVICESLPATWRFILPLNSSSGIAHGRTSNLHRRCSVSIGCPPGTASRHHRSWRRGRYLHSRHVVESGSLPTCDTRRSALAGRSRVEQWDARQRRQNGRHSNPERRPDYGRHHNVPCRVFAIAGVSGIDSVGSNPRSIVSSICNDVTSRYCSAATITTPSDILVIWECSCRGCGHVPESWIETGTALPW